MDNQKEGKKEKRKARTRTIIIRQMDNDLMEVDNAAVYHNVRKALAAKEFFTFGGLWPTADLTTPNRKLQGYAEIKPPEKEIGPFPTEEQIAKWQKFMAQHMLAMNDLTADVLDIIACIWLKHAKHPLDMAKVTADDFLSIRGIQEHKGGNDRRGGYMDEQRQVIANQIAVLSYTWITVTEMEIIELMEGKRCPYRKRKKWRGESVAIVVDARCGPVDDHEIFNPYIWQVRPGSVFAPFLFGPGRQTALLSRKAVEYDPYRQKWEKRLTRYFAYQWRIRQGSGNYLYPFQVETLLKAISEEVDPLHPLRTKERLEKALDQLVEDGVINAWQYDQICELIVGNPGWSLEWLLRKILVEPPQEVLDQYAKIKNPAPPRKALPCPQPNDLAQLLRQTRLDRRLTQMQAAEQIGIEQCKISRIESGRKTAPATVKKVEQWIGREP